MLLINMYRKNGVLWTIPTEHVKLAVRDTMQLKFASAQYYTLKFADRRYRVI